MSPDQAATWKALLDRLEADIALAVSGGAPDAWHLPADPGPIPPELSARAARVLDAQQETLALLTKTRNDAAAQLAALNSVPDGRSSGHAVYLDVRT